MIIKDFLHQFTWPSYTTLLLIKDVNEKITLHMAIICSIDTLMIEFEVINNEYNGNVNGNLKTSY